MDANNGDINDLFDSIVLSEDRIVCESYETGYKAGESEGFSEGLRLGSERGKKIGSEIGFYLGFVEQWRKFYLTESGDQHRREKVLSALNKLEKAAVDFPHFNSREELSVKLDSIRSKFKLVCSLLKINSVFGDSNTW